MTFYVGQKVVCVNDLNWYEPSASKYFPKRGSIYTIRGMRGPYFDGMHGCYLNEIINPPDANGEEWTFCVSRFRPVTDRKTDISIFTQMLTPNSKEKIKT